MPGPARLTIRAASALTGINQNTLRAWERRHGLVCPERTAKGYRLYTHENIEQLRRIQTALQQGIPVGRVTEYLEAQDAREDRAAAESPATPAAEAGRRDAAAVRERAEGHTLADFADQIEEATHRFDRPALERSFNRAIGIHGLLPAFREALAPALRRVGERYLANVANVAEEHFLEGFARERLMIALTGLRPLHQQPRVLCACIVGEQHEIGLMLLALEVGLRGISTLYLGRDLPVEAIAHAAASSVCRVVAISCTMRLPREAVIDLKGRLSMNARRPVLMLGGHASVRERAWVEANGMRVLPLATDLAGEMAVEAVRRG